MNAITLVNIKENFLEFDVTVQGTVDNNDMLVYFVIHTCEVDLRFKARKKEGSDSKWEVDVPPIPYIEKTAYNYSIEVIVDGYFFSPMDGVVNVVGTHDIYVQQPTNVTLTSTVPEPPSDIVSTPPARPAFTMTPPDSVAPPLPGKDDVTSIASKIMHDLSLTDSVEEPEAKKPSKKKQSKKSKDNLDSMLDDLLHSKVGKHKVDKVIPPKGLLKKKRVVVK